MPYFFFTSKYVFIHVPVVLVKIILFYQLLIEYLLWVRSFVVWHLAGQYSVNFCPSCSDLQVICKPEWASVKRKDLFLPKPSLYLNWKPISNFSCFQITNISWYMVHTLFSKCSTHLQTWPHTASRIRKASAEMWILVYSCGRNFSIKDMRNVFAVKSVKSMPCEARGGKKNSDRNWRDICRGLFCRHGLLVIFFFLIITEQASRKVTELELKLICKITL